MSFATFSLAQLRQRTGAKWKRYGPEVIPCWVADMDFPLAPPIRRYLAGAVEREEFGYPLKSDGEQVKALFAARMAQRFGWQPEPRRCVLVTDVVQAIYVAVDRFSAPGQQVILHTPLYPPFFGAVLETGREILRNPLIENQSGWQLDVDSLRAAITPQTRMLALCNPHNPSGRAFTLDELERLAGIVLEHDLIVMADEIHSDLVYEGARHVPFASLSGEVAARTITFNSAGKTFNTAGLRTAVVHFGSEALQKRFQSIPPRVLGGLPCHAAEVMAIAWTECEPWHRDCVAYLQGNRDALVRFVAEHMPGVRCQPPEATYLAWLDFRACELGEDPHAFFLREAKVALSPGPDFGDPEGVGCARLNFATSRELLMEILGRMATALARRRQLT
jgi:cystathionine beta-lyase